MNTFQMGSWDHGMPPASCHPPTPRLSVERLGQHALFILYADQDDMGPAVSGALDKEGDMSRRASRTPTGKVAANRRSQAATAAAFDEVDTTDSSTDLEVDTTDSSTDLEGGYPPASQAKARMSAVARGKQRAVIPAPARRGLGDLERAGVATDSDEDGEDVSLRGSAGISVEYKSEQRR